MDRPIERKKWPARRVSLAAFAGVGAAGIGYLVATSGTARLTIDPVDAGRLAVSQVRRAEFQEYVPINGVIQPKNSVYLDLEEGGIVAHIYVESGVSLRKGDLILAFSNSTVQKQNIETETRLLENLNQLRSSRMSLTQSSLVLKEQLLDVNYKIADLEKTFDRYQRLMQDRSAQISREQFESTSEQLTYYRNKRQLLEERIRLESALQQQQTAQIDWSMQRIDRNLETLARIVQSLEVRAPVDGYLSALNAQVGQSFQRGERIGQMDQLDGFKVRAEADQYYIGKVTTGQRGSFSFSGESYQVVVEKIYPEVKNSVFELDLTFADTVPEGIKRGQTLQIDLSLSESKTTNVVSKGGFYRHTNGHWAYVLASDGSHARRVRIVPGRQNPQDVEVVEGLRPGDWVITSSYDAFDDADELRFSQPLRATAAGGRR